MAFGTHCGELLEGRYQLMKLLGKGGMGEVYLGKHMGIGKHVAVKLLLSSFSQNKSVVERFHREARAAAAINHKNIIEVLDVGVAPWGDPFIVMEYLEGESLGSTLLRVGPLSLAATIGIMEPVLKALGAAHHAGIIHRDLKPDNIFLSRDADGEVIVKLIDFGISKILAGDDQNQLTLEGSVMGTPTYMAPEQARGSMELDQRVDVYAIGVILFEMLTGHLPFTGENYNSIMIAVLTQPPPLPTTVYPDFDNAALPIVLTALEKKPENRFSSVTEMLSTFTALPVFGERKTALISLGNSMVKSTLAIGDLGGATNLFDSADVFGPTKTPSELKKKRTIIKNNSLNKKSLGIGAGLILLTVISSGLAILWTKGYLKQQLPVRVSIANERPSQKPVETKSDPIAEGVSIEVTGLPAEAKIYYRDMLVPQNPFRVEKRGVISQLRVEMPGFKTYKVGLTPVKDKIININLEKLPGPPHKKKAKKNTPAKTTQKIPDRLSRTQTDEVYNKNKNQLVTCYNRALSAKTVPNNNGFMIKLRLKIKPSGMVRHVSFAGEGAQYEGLKKCLSTTVRTWIFPASKNGGKEIFPILFTSK